MMILGERYDERYGFDCDNYDPYDPFAEDDAFEAYFDGVKADVAWTLGIEEGSDEWWELMDI